MVSSEVKADALFCCNVRGRMKLFPAALFSIGLISMIWSCLVAATDADDRSEEYWRNKEIEKER